MAHQFHRLGQQMPGQYGAMASSQGPKVAGSQLLTQTGATAASTPGAGGGPANFPLIPSFDASPFVTHTGMMAPSQMMASQMTAGGSTSLSTPSAPVVLFSSGDFLLSRLALEENLAQASFTVLRYVYAATSQDEENRVRKLLASVPRTSTWQQTTTSATWQQTTQVLRIDQEESSLVHQCEALRLQIHQLLGGRPWMPVCVLSDPGTCFDPSLKVPASQQPNLFPFRGVPLRTHYVAAQSIMGTPHVATILTLQRDCGGLVRTAFGNKPSAFPPTLAGLKDGRAWYVNFGLPAKCTKFSTQAGTGATQQSHLQCKTSSVMPHFSDIVYAPYQPSESFGETASLRPQPRTLDVDLVEGPNIQRHLQGQGSMGLGAEIKRSMPSNGLPTLNDMSLVMSRLLGFYG
ncbi:unnamed protein product [Amoebophrya sp. A25]|nr:unnamed protein product [Amoebophrya sp. A25]|eukprot:GSA25T00001309001.1